VVGESVELISAIAPLSRVSLALLLGYPVVLRFPGRCSRPCG